MSKIPFNFTPIPRYFYENGYFKNPKMIIFILWAFSRCSSEKRAVYHIQSIVELDPFEFIFGRKVCSDETGLTEMEVRGILHQLDGTKSLKIIEKTTSKTTNKFSVYKWLTDVFSNYDNQQNNQQTTSRQPADNHKQELKNKRIKKEPPLTPPGEGNGGGFSSESGEALIEICSGVRLTQADLDECIACRGNLETVELIIRQILSKKYKKIKHWVDSIKKWNIEDDLHQKIIENETLAKKLESMYSETKSGWSCRIYNDKRKDQKGLLFEGRGARVEPIFIPFSYYDFKQQVAKIIREKGMQKSLEKQEQTC